MYIGKYFTLAEMCRTGSGLVNEPATHELISLTRLVALCLDPLREDVGALKVTSGYRSESVNKAVGGAVRSFHRHGLAADLQSDTHTVDELVERIEYLALPFDKLIMEYAGTKPWLHWQIVEPNRTNRKEVYTARIVDGKMEYQRIM
jgi:hypothetical protein